MSPISTKRHGDVLIVTSNNPPVNALGFAVREGLVKAIEEADADDGDGGGDRLQCQNSAPAPPHEFGKPMRAMLPIGRHLANCTKPWSRDPLTASAAGSRSRWRVITGSPSRRRNWGFPR